jgi:hypothetical protein
VQVFGSGNLRVSVLDAGDNLIPDTALPGNSTGFTARTIHLWDLDRRIYPVIKLRATVPSGASLREWRAFANTRYEWDFTTDGDTEGWVAGDFRSTPTMVAQMGVLRFDGLMAGSDPHVEYSFPQPVAATRFTRVEVTVRSSNMVQNDDVVFHWQSNFGGFDMNRSFTRPQVSLQAFQTVTFDLSAMTTAPRQPWQGDIEKLRIDPVVRFVQQGMTMIEPADGWFEIEKIAIY